MAIAPLQQVGQKAASLVTSTAILHGMSENRKQIHRRAWEMNQSVMFFPYNHEDLSLDPQHSHKVKRQARQFMPITLVLGTRVEK